MCIFFFATRANTSSTIIPKTSSKANSKTLAAVPTARIGKSTLARTVAALIVLCETASAPAFALPPTPGSWEESQSRGKAACETMEYGIAERQLKEAVAKARGFAPGDIRLAKSAGELGRLLAIRGRFAEAEPYLEEELRVKELAAGNEKGQLIPSMGSLVRFYLTGGTVLKADPLTEELLSFVEGKYNEASGQTKIKIQKGMPLQGWAGTAAPAMRDPLIEWAITCDDIGNLYRVNGNLDLAQRLYKAALDVKETVLGKQHLSLANSYESLGTICAEKNANEDAESYYKDALEITERIQPPEHPQVYARLDKLGKMLIKEGKLKEAEALYLRAQGFWKLAPSKCGNEFRALYSLGSIYAQEKDYANAAPALEQAWQLSEEYNGTDSIALVPYLQKYAYVLYYLGRKPESDQLKALATALTAGVEQ